MERPEYPYEIMLMNIKASGCIGEWMDYADHLENVLEAMEEEKSNGET